MFTILIFSQELDKKKLHLEELNQKIEQEKKCIEENQSKKKSTEKNISSTKKKKKLAEKEIKNLNYIESKTKSQLDKLITVISDESSHLEKLNHFCEKELIQLTILHYQSELFPQKKVDCHIIANLIGRTSEDIFLAEDKLEILQNDKNETNQKYEKVISSKKTEKKKKKKLSQKISNMNDEVLQCEKNLSDAKKRRQNFEEEANALDDLISKLQTEILNVEFSYKFSTEKLIWPIKGEIIRDFGEQKSDEYKVSINNDGIDISATEGSEIVSIENGIVAYARWYEGAGKLVIINHQNGFSTLYSHNSKILVAKGDTVKKSQVIALSGRKSLAEKPCLHFELRKRGIPVNPMDYLE